MLLMHDPSEKRNLQRKFVRVKLIFFWDHAEAEVQLVLIGRCDSCTINR